MVALIVHAGAGLGFLLGAGRDDAFISLWQGARLAEGLGFVNHNFEPAEISSSFLHTCVIALLYKAAPEQLFLLNKLFGLAVGGLVLCLLAVFRRAFFGDTGLVSLGAYAAALLLTATNPGLLYWHLGGLETPYVAVLLLLYAGLAADYARRQTAGHLALLGAAGALLVATRPEGFYIILFGLVFLVIEARGRGFRPALLLPVLLPAAALLLLTAWRWNTFGLLLPAPAYAKSDALSHALPKGARYLFQFHASSLFLMLCAALALIAGCARAAALKRLLRAPGAGARVPRHLYTLGLLLTVNLVVMAAGGDWMEYFRFLAPTAPLLIAVAMDSLGQGVRAMNAALESTRQRTGLIAIAVVVAALLGVSNVLQNGENIHGEGMVNRTKSSALPYDIRDMYRDWQGLQARAMDVCLPVKRDREGALPFIQRELPALYAEAGRLVIAANQMGYFPYTLRETWPEWDLRIIDFGGLCEPAIARMPLPKKDPAQRELFHIDRILAGETPYLSAYLLAFEPNLVYSLGYAPQWEARVERLAALGYVLVWDRPGAKFFFRPPPGANSPG